MEDTIKRFFECLIPITSCNLKCNYCYVIQRDNRKMEIPKLKYSAERIGLALTKERLGGTCYFSICGAGETLIPKDTIDIAYQLLKNGHFINITTNGTLTKRFDEIELFPEEYRSRIHFAFSLHYNELKRLNLLETFFYNVKKVKSFGASFLVQINLVDEYLPYIEEIKEICLKEIGAYPQVAATRKEEDLKTEIELMTDLTKEEYIKIGESFNSPLFSFTMKNFNKKREEFCYAGAWSGTLNLATGELSKCYGPNTVDIFKNIEKPIDFSPIGNNCCSLFCMNSSHFLSLGNIPELDTPSYSSLRNRPEAGWYTKRMENFLNQKLSDNNEVLDKKDMEFANDRVKKMLKLVKVKRALKNRIKVIIGK